MRFTPYGLFACRLIVGGLLALHAWQKIREPEDFAVTVRELGMPLPEAVASATILVECGVAVLVLAGLFTRVAGAVLAGHMAVVWAIVHARYPLVSDAGLTGELAVLYVAAGLGILAVGAGPLSLDGLLARRRSDEDPVPHGADVISSAR